MLSVTVKDSPREILDVLIDDIFSPSGSVGFIGSINNKYESESETERSLGCLLTAGI